MLIVRSPITRKPEREYIYQVILKEFLGVEFSVVYEEREEIELSHRDGGEESIRFPDVFFQTDDADWLKPVSMPVRPLKRIRLFGYEDLPVIYGRPGTEGGYVQEEGRSLFCGIDLFGSSFFMLTRYEELVETKRDNHNRASAKDSIAWQEQFLDRPIVNEYVDCLMYFIKKLWPAIELKARRPRLLVSHDVDLPYYVYGRSRFSIVKEVLGDIIRRKDFESGLQKGKMLFTGKQNLSADPYNTFDWLMSHSERVGSCSAFYFIPEETEPGMDGNYEIDDPRIMALMKEMCARGHEIGFHPSYDTFEHGDRIRSQFHKLQQIARSLHIPQRQWGGRQHYLRWSAAETWQHWEDAGLAYDSTLSYADHVGFRCGVCYEYPVFNVLTRKPLKLRERPLIVMDQTLLQPEYMGLSDSQAIEKIQLLRKQCFRHNGDFTLLWHNSQLVKAAERRIFQAGMEQ
ncbi:polysaccharide deacetylase family protein [Paenibacillus sp. YAF4_2]|uniref:polysaccharide deacetylase family protein n=1 Tax=Paenibacillus sp. YAF4_2 TaxID=3233085 RepID=UPI003F946266